LNPRDDRGCVQSGSLPEQPLVASNAGAMSDGDADGWRTYVAFLEQDGEPPEIAIYCPAAPSSNSASSFEPWRRGLRVADPP
jgi:hypothetical protein